MDPFAGFYDYLEMTEEFDKNSEKAKETKEAVETAFAKADTEGTGKLTRDQLEGVLRELSESGHDTDFLLGKKILIPKWFTYIMGCQIQYDDAVSLFIEVADRDGDKLINLNELLMIMNLGDEDLNHKEMLTKMITASAKLCEDNSSGRHIFGEPIFGEPTNKDRNGLVTIKELRYMMFLAGLEGETRMALIKMDEDKKLKIEEVVNLFIEPKKAKEMGQKEEMKQIFRLFDTNADGFISKEELAESFLFAGDDTPEEIKMVANQFMAEKNGKLNYEEFCNFLEMTNHM